VKLDGGPGDGEAEAKPRSAVGFPEEPLKDAFFAPGDEARALVDQFEAADVGLA